MLRCLRRPSRKRIYQLAESSALDLATRSRSTFSVVSEVSLLLSQVDRVKQKGGLHPIQVSAHGKLSAGDRRFFFALMLRRQYRQEVPLERLQEFVAMNGVLVLGGEFHPPPVLPRRRSV